MQTNRVDLTYPQGFRTDPLLSSVVLPIANYRPTIKHDCKKQQYSELRQQIKETTPLQIYHSHHLHKILQRIEYRYYLCPFRHAANGGKQTAHQNHHQQTEPHNKH